MEGEAGREVKVRWREGGKKEKDRRREGGKRETEEGGGKREIEGETITKMKGRREL